MYQNRAKIEWQQKMYKKEIFSGTLQKKNEKREKIKRHSGIFKR